MTIELSTDMTTEEYAAKAIDLLKEWKAGFSKWDGMLKELNERYADGTITQEFSEQVDAMGDKLDDISYEAAEIMRMRVFGADVHAVDSGTRTLKDAINEALRYYQTACQMEPGNPEYRQALAMMQRGGQAYRPYGYGGGGIDACDCCTACMCANICCGGWG